ncbi:MAG: sulfide/dihydroorotate dehydrogenase-like FAD/NAD-binding protein, partial [Clostridia bacterium]|nr:sulfide/dihydroorotate dehydrogenase-like FAD/NAD-binding protein [Clostridia bacterium]
MYKIVRKKVLNPTVSLMEIEAPLIARKAEPGQFIIFRAKEDSERVPLTIADFDREKGTVTIIYQIVGGSTMELDSLQEGDSLQDFVGPLGRPSETDGLKKVAVVGGGVGCAIAYPLAKKLSALGCEVHSIVGFRNKDLVILEDEFRAVSSELRIMTDDGSYGTKGLVTNALETLIQEGNQYDEVIAIGPVIMMKFVCLLTKKYNIKTIVSMNPIMIDGTGMCG